jgi:hypothetical protein
MIPIVDSRVYQIKFELIKLNHNPILKMMHKQDLVLQEKVTSKVGLKTYLIKIERKKLAEFLSQVLQNI